MKPIVWVVLVIAGTGVAAAEVHRKPVAPVAVRLESAAAPGGFDVTLVAVPTRDVPAIELSLGGQRIAFGATAAGQRRELVVRVAAGAYPAGGIDVVGQARVNGRTKVAVLRAGIVKTAPKRHATLRTLPDGSVVREAR